MDYRIIKFQKGIILLDKPNRLIFNFIKGDCYERKRAKETSE